MPTIEPAYPQHLKTKELALLTGRLERLRGNGKVGDRRRARHAHLERPVRELHGAAAILGLSVLADSAVEHYRGSFKNRAMFLPLISSLANIFVAADGIKTPMSRRNGARSLAYDAAIAVGAVGAGFHLYNVGKRVGGFRWENLFYGAPLGAPGALALSGLIGLSGDRLGRNVGCTGRATLFGRPAGRLLAGLTSLGLLGTVTEAGLLHFRGNFQNPAMYLPVTLPPIAAAVLAVAALDRSQRSHKPARAWLGLTAILGIAGAGFHAYGVSRAMGGWKNWRQNVVDGPPIPAPPSFSGLALAGLAALRMIERERP